MKRSPKDATRRFVLAISVIRCFRRMGPNEMIWKSLSSSDISQILSTFQLFDIECYRSVNMDTLFNLIHPLEEIVTDDLITLCIRLASSEHLKQPQWFYAVPLIHFLRKQSFPFENPEKFGREIKWQDPETDFGLYILRKRTAKKNKVK